MLDTMEVIQETIKGLPIVTVTLTLDDLELCWLEVI